MRRLSPAILTLGCALAIPTSIASAAGEGAIDFEKQIAPLLEDKCLKCHSGQKPKGKYSMVTKESAFADGLIVPGDPNKGDFFWLIITGDEDDVMPPIKNGGPLKDEEKELVRRWIAEGADWPDGFELGKKKGPDFETEIKPILDKLSADERQKIKQWIEAGAEWPGVFLLPLSGTLGIGLRHQEIERIAEEADKYGPGQIIVLLIDSPGGLVIEGDKISDSINRIKKNHRVVAWIREAISGGAFTALHCDENYYMSFGALGAITMFAGQTAASGAELQAWLQRCADVAEAGGRNKYVVQAMIHAPLLVSYDRDEDTGRVTYYNTLEGEYDLSDEVNNLTLNASNALHSGYSQGTADTEEELARLMQLPEWKEAANGVGRRIHDDWQRNVEQAQEEVPKLVQRLNFKGSGTGDPAVVLGTRIQILQEILRWYDRCYPVCVYEVGLPGDPEPLKRQLEELRYQLGQMRRRN